MSFLHWPTQLHLPPPSSVFAQSLCHRIPTYHPNDVHEPQLALILTEKIKESSDGNSQVFRAKWQIGGSESRNESETASVLGIPGSTVICKVGYGERRVRSLIKEATFYEKLVDIQGSCIPRIVGFFVGEVNPEEGRTAVLVMQDCGDALWKDLKKYSLDIRMAAVRSLMRVHHYGVRHRDFEERNLVLNENDDESVSITLVDFGMSEDHAPPCCPRSQVISIGGIAPTPDNFGCYELYNACVAAGIWKPLEFAFMGSTVPTNWALGTREELMKRVRDELDAKRMCLAWNEDEIEEYMPMECEEIMNELAQWDKDNDGLKELLLLSTTQ
ncbi:hypothetical protein L226DRAFT_616041 [Lentinus tigrinus ALCF2SS1-7]|uniref:Protein kinase domain-containing protein n=1 Tax=Lentinus tigrinus ALCF2SS1-6 TaxID=1328759 RepID=A0A5C2RUR7_9APHY|nr:hypothetical protein L227DRAFT_603500 [Lentinus tigrinus ALCF2SS1-6]RPD70712.1 hypothetical protein L226DRAFT_616041 [Lentinus tigrinus ALCF2SS1-7]